jgi:hypothetical protein
VANVQHSALTDPDIHEPKGAASATVGQVYVANGAGSGNWSLPIKKYTASLTPSSVGANSTSEQTFTVTGLVASTDTIIGVSKPTHQTGIGIVGWRCSANNQIAITFMNTTAGGITPTGGETYTIFAHRA